jgi:hypothetical protein
MSLAHKIGRGRDSGYLLPPAHTRAGAGVAPLDAPSDKVEAAIVETRSFCEAIDHEFMKNPPYWWSSRLRRAGAEHRSATNCLEPANRYSAWMPPRRNLETGRSRFLAASSCRQNSLVGLRPVPLLICGGLPSTSTEEGFLLDAFRRPQSCALRQPALEHSKFLIRGCGVLQGPS